MKQYTLTAFSKDSENFEMQITAHENILFSELHQAIQSALEFDPLQMASFFLCNADWDKETEIALMDMEDQGNTKLMADFVLSDMIKAEGQKLIYLYDFFSERFFSMNIDEILEKEQAAFSINVLGDVPLQINIDSEGIDDLMSSIGEIDKEKLNADLKDEYKDEFDDAFNNENISFENIDDLEDY